MADESTGTGSRLYSREGLSRGAVIIALVDRARNDREFAAALRRDPVLTASRLGCQLSDSEWAGLRHLIIE